MTLEFAEKFIAGAKRKAEELGISVGIAVVDNGGRLVAAARMTNAVWICVPAAQAKAFTASTFRKATASLSEVMSPDGPGGRFLGPLGEAAGATLWFGGGGVPLALGNQPLGAGACSGASEAQDIECAEAGLRAALAD